MTAFQKDPESEFDIDRFIEQYRESRRAAHSKRREITFREYYDLVRQDPLLVQNSRGRIRELVMAEGVKELPPRDRMFGATLRYEFFAKHLYGIERAVEQTMRFINAGAEQGSTGKQILVLYGPPASGKSTFVRLLWRGLEAYHARPVFHIKGCPMHEEPLHLLPRFVRREKWDADKARAFGFNKPIEDVLGIKTIKGDLCPPCRHLLQHQYQTEQGIPEWWNVLVESFSFSVQGGVGVGSFEPSDEKSQDVSELVGRENIGVTQNPHRGYDDPFAFSLTGEIEKANRGILEGRELLKKGIDERLLWVFINLGEEEEIKVQGSPFPHIGIDTFTIGHCNLVGFKDFNSNKANEALHNRFFPVPFPYPLRVQDEVRVYRKLIEDESSLLKGLHACHVSPGALELAAQFAILTRLTPSGLVGNSLMTKLKGYNGEKILVDEKDKERRPIDWRVVVEEGQKADDLAKREGMFGLSSRDVLAAINDKLVEVQQQAGSAPTCLTCLGVLRALRDKVPNRMGYTPEEIRHFLEFLSEEASDSVIKEFKDFILKEASRSFLKAFDSEKKKLIRKYIKEARFWSRIKRKFVRADILDVERDALTGKPKEADVKFLKSLETHHDPSFDGESAAEVFRGEIAAEFTEESPDSLLEQYEPLIRMVEKKLLEDGKDILVHILDPDRAHTYEEESRGKDLFTGLRQRGFCEICARETVEETTKLLVHA